MIAFLKNFLNTARVEPDKPAVVDLDGRRATSYRELCACAYRVNAWIRDHGLGRESVSAIYLPKGMEYIATRIGIMMAGSAWVGLEDLMGKERMRYVIRDSGCKTVIDREKWAEAMQYDECHEIEDADPHDLAFIIYTSGSTGNPKGIMQEYGLYDSTVEWAHKAFLNRRDIVFADVVPLTFITCVMISISILSEKGALHEISADTTRNLKALTEYFIAEKITDSFLPPALLKFYANKTGLRLLNVFTGGDFVSELYTDQFMIRNLYGSTEVGYPAIMFTIDKSYLYTPVGCPTCGADVVLLDENDRPSDEGELCITIPYFRGYLGDDRECFITMNGKRFFRTNDYVRRDAEGRYIIFNRLDNMVKLNGNRVDLREVELTVQRALGLDTCCVKLFMNNGIKLLCAYYTGNHEVNNSLAAKELRKHIPEYMIPGFYIRLDSFPLNANGKIEKHALPEPDLALRTVPYCAPQDPVQEMLCTTIKSVLESTEDVGIDDDFFSLGGDSVRAMEVLASCDIPGLSVQMIYEGRSVRRIKALLDKAGKKDVVEGEMFSPAPLNIGQLYLLRADLKYPGTCMLNLPVRLSILPDVNMERLAKAVRRAIKAHPALLSTIIEKDGSYFLNYRPEFDREIPVEEMTDEKLEQAVKHFVQPFHLDGTPLVRCRIINTGNQKAVLLDVCHVICDGISLGKLISDFDKSYAGVEIAPDQCYSLLREEESCRSSGQFKRDMDYFAALCDHPGWDTLPRADHDSAESTDDTVFRSFSFNPEEADRLARKYGLGKNGLYVAATALSIAAYNKSENIMFTWTWHDRSDRRRADSVTPFTKDIPIALRLKPGLLLTELFEEICTQIREGIAHGRVSYWIERYAYYGKDLTCLLYQGDIYEYHEDHGVIHSVQELPSGPMACNNTLDIEILEGREDFGVLLDYNAKLYDRTSMERLATLFCAICEQIVTNNSASQTIGDFIRLV